MPFRSRITCLVAALFAGSMAFAASASATTQTFYYTGGAQTWQVPAGVTQATFDLYGAVGGTSISGPYNFGDGGLGGRATATVSVVPNSTIEIRVGGPGRYASGAGGGWNGGGSGTLGSGGGGATDIRIDGSTLTDRVLVAGGGGGGGGCSNGTLNPDGGSGGGEVGQSGSAYDCDGAPGGGGTQSAGGAAGGPTATAGQAGTGGNGNYGGGGGGGWYGGGGGWERAAGGGGSGYGPAGTTFQTGVRPTDSGVGPGQGFASVTYTLPQQDLSLTTAGTGSGYVDSSPTGIDCGRNTTGHSSCTKSYPDGIPVTLTAHPDANTTFAGFSGDCTDSGLTCTTSMSAAKNVTATFDLKQRTLTVNPDGTGAGTVTGAGIDCGGAGHTDCAETVEHGSKITLTASPAANADFAGFSGGGCSTSPCEVTLDADKSVGTTFDLKQRDLAVTTAGTGSGYVGSSPAGMDCGRNMSARAACSDTYADGTVVTLTAHPTANSEFTGFTGDCAGTSTTCTVTMSAARNVTAAFAMKRHALTVTGSGPGAGTVSSDPAGIDCAPACGGDFDEGSLVTLTATPQDGSGFAGFAGGGCSGEAMTCAVVIGPEPLSVEARFTDKTPPDTIIGSTPRNSGAKHSRFGFHSTEPGSSFACAVDGAEVQPCRALQDYPRLGRGRHVFSVAATDPYGNTDPTPAKARFRIRSRR